MYFEEIVAPGVKYFTDFEVSTELEDWDEFSKKVVFKHIFNHDVMGLVVKHDDEEYVLMVNDLVSSEYFDNFKYDLFNDLFYTDFTKEEVDKLENIEIEDWLFNKGHAPKHALYLEPYFKTNLSKKGNIKISHTLGLKTLKLNEEFIKTVLDKLMNNYQQANDALNKLPISAQESVLATYSY